MRRFDYNAVPEGLITAETMDLLSAVHEYKGRQALYLAAKPDVLDALTEVAKVQSAEASNRIEGIRTSDKRLREIMLDKTDLQSRDEEEIAGYRDVLSLVHENYEFMDVTPGVILQLHRQMYRHTASSMGGHFKIGDNEVRGVRKDGTEYVRLKTVPAVATEQAMELLCSAYRDAVAREAVDPLLASMMFVLDFTCVHPFNDGNGRMSRLLTLLLLHKAGYLVGRYVSVEKEIERTKGAYYDALAASSEGWHENASDPGPFVRYMLGVVLAAYRELEDRVSLVTGAGSSKSDRVEAVLRNGIGKITKREVLEICPDISMTTIERTLASLLADGKIEKVGAGPVTGYTWKG